MSALDAPAVEALVRELELIRAVVNTVLHALGAQPTDDDPDFEMTLMEFASNPLTQIIDRLQGRDDTGSAS
jgi:hypothetical protein